MPQPTSFERDRADELEHLFIWEGSDNGGPPDEWIKQRGNVLFDPDPLVFPDGWWTIAGNQENNQTVEAITIYSSDGLPRQYFISVYFQDGLDQQIGADLLAEAKQRFPYAFKAIN